MERKTAVEDSTILTRLEGHVLSSYTRTIQTRSFILTTFTGNYEEYSIFFLLYLKRAWRLLSSSLGQSPDSEYEALCSSPGIPLLCFIPPSEKCTPPSLQKSIKDRSTKNEKCVLGKYELMSHCLCSPTLTNSSTRQESRMHYYSCS